MDKDPVLPGSFSEKPEEQIHPSSEASSSLKMIRNEDLEKLKLGQPSRKRLRARTTVLTVPIGDFRRMVQELTGGVQVKDKYLGTDLVPFVTYCFLFPFNYEFTKEELVTLWIAEGLFQIQVPIGGQESPEDVANGKFDLLVSMEIIVPSRTEQFVDFWTPKTRRLLYKVNKFGISSFERCESRTGYAIISDAAELSNVPEMVLHLFIYGKIMDRVAFESVKRFKNLRTLFLTPAYGLSVKQVPRDLFLGLKHLRSMNLSRSLLYELPSSIGYLKSLRYMDLSYTLIKQLPETICNLHNLQTLKLRGCSDLVGLPIGMGKLTSLRHLDLDIIRQLTSMPQGMGNLTNLQTLSAYLVGRDEGCGIGELKHILNLKGAFCISRIENVLNFKEAEEANLIKKEFLSKLELRWTDIRVDSVIEEEVLEQLQPAFGLEELRILYYGGSKLPSWICNPSYTSLVDITLYNFRNCQILSSIGQLPSLQYLHIKEMNGLKIIDHQFCRNERGQQYLAFPRLEKLTIEVMPALEEWIGIGNGDFPSLHKLKVEHCPKLLSLPLLSCLYSLEHLEVSYCPGISSLPDGKVASTLEFLLIKDCAELEKHCRKGDGQDWAKIAHVPNIFINDEVISCQ